MSNPPSAPTAQEIDVDKLPVAAILVGFGRGSARVALAGNRDGTLIWRAADRAEIHTRQGILVRTVGLPDNLRIVRIDSLPEGASAPVPAAAAPLVHRTAAPGYASDPATISSTPREYLSSS